MRFASEELDDGAKTGNEGVDHIIPKEEWNENMDEDEEELPL